jgi:hypothetical protein
MSLSVTVEPWIDFSSTTCSARFHAAEAGSRSLEAVSVYAFDIIAARGSVDDRGQEFRARWTADGNCGSARRLRGDSSHDCRAFWLAPATRRFGSSRAPPSCAQPAHVSAPVSFTVDQQHQHLDVPARYGSGARSQLTSLPSRVQVGPPLRIRVSPDWYMARDRKRRRAGQRIVKVGSRAALIGAAAAIARAVDADRSAAASSLDRRVASVCRLARPSR